MAALNAGAPRITDRLCDACAEHFAAVRAHLDALGVPYRLEPGLVRGLDYYTRTAFEFYVAGREGQQQALGGGGRYDGLVELLGGRPTPGIGFGLGLDRRRPRARRAGARPTAGAAPPSRSSSAPTRTTRSTRLRIATDLRAAGLAARAELGQRKLGKQLEAAARDGAHFAVILGDELADGEVSLRDLRPGRRRSCRSPTWRVRSSAPTPPTATAERIYAAQELIDADPVIAGGFARGELRPFRVASMRGRDG